VGRPPACARARLDAGRGHGGLRAARRHDDHAQAWETLRDELLADLRAALPVDVVLLGLHGAMVADGCDDCEGELLRQVRAIVGPGVVVGAELDPHHHLSAAMREHADLLIAFKEYPHTDMLERAFELVDLCAAQARPHPAGGGVVDCG
jgi:microcystin degradation protein MlrC